MYSVLVLQKRRDSELHKAGKISTFRKELKLIQASSLYWIHCVNYLSSLGAIRGSVSCVGTLCILSLPDESVPVSDVFIVGAY